MEDFEQLVSSLTPLEDTDTVSVYQNTVAIACPACEEPFDDMIVCRDEFNELDLSVALDLCTTVHDGDVVLFTHKP